MEPILHTVCQLQHFSVILMRVCQSLHSIEKYDLFFFIRHGPSLFNIVWDVFFHPLKKHSILVCFPVLVITWYLAPVTLLVRTYILPSRLSRQSHRLLFDPTAPSQILFIACVVALVRAPASLFIRLCSLWPVSCLTGHNRFSIVLSKLAHTATVTTAHYKDVLLQLLYLTDYSKFSDTAAKQQSDCLSDEICAVTIQHHVLVQQQ